MRLAHRRCFDRESLSGCRAQGDLESIPSLPVASLDMTSGSSQVPVKEPIVGKSHRSKRLDLFFLPPCLFWKVTLTKKSTLFLLRNRKRSRSSCSVRAFISLRRKGIELRMLIQQGYYRERMRGAHLTECRALFVVLVPLLQFQW